MRFLYPLFLVGAIAAALPIVLHLLRRQAAPEVPFTAVRLLRHAPPEQTRRRRLRDVLLLATRIAALVLLASAFARPYVIGASRDVPLVIVAIDRSYSMGAPGAFDRAIALARETIDGADSAGGIALIAFDDRADVMSAPAGLQEARAALRELRPAFGSTRYAPVFARAAEVAGQGSARLVIVSDLQRSGWENEEPVAVPAGIRVELRDTGGSGSNLAVTDLRRESNGVAVSVRNAGTAAIVSQARLMYDGRQVAQTSFSAPPSAALDVHLPYRAPSRGTLSVEIDDRDGYAADNVRYVVLDRDAKPGVLIIGTGDSQSGFYMTRALQSADSDVAVKPSSSIGAMSSDDLADNGAAVLLSTRSLDRKARDLLAGFVRAGGGLFVAASPEIDPAALAAMMGWSGFAAVEQASAPVALAATDPRHPVFRAFGALAANLGQVRFNRTWTIRGDGWEVAARFTNGSPALVERREGEGRVVVFASDVDRRWNDFPLHPAFVPFALEVVRHITPPSDLKRAYLVGDAPRGARPQPGVYSLQPNGRVVAVNVDVRESMTTRMTAEAFTAMIRPVASSSAASSERRAHQVEERQSLWRYGLLLMMAALVSESFIGRARS